MPTDPPRRILTCFSYLALAQLLRVDHFPKSNYGAEVRHLSEAVAADGVIVATACSRLGVQAVLASNPIGNDHAGHRLAELLRARDVQCDLMRNGVVTPSIFVVTDSVGNRVWLPFLPRVTSILERLDLAGLDQADMVYVDCYELLTQPALRVIRRCVDRGIRLFVNLGGSDVPAELVHEPLPIGAVEVAQTNVSESGLDQAGDAAQALRGAFGATSVVVTAGSKGAVGFLPTGEVRAAAYQVEVRHVHGAGAAVSAVLACGLLHGRDLVEVLPMACAAGSWRCEAEPSDSPPSFADLQNFVAHRMMLA
jgi:sugar/nucleoside kinase (ribokinase family)